MHPCSGISDTLWHISPIMSMRLVISSHEARWKQSKLPEPSVAQTASTLLVSLDKRIPFERCQSALPTMYFYCVCIPLLNSWLDIANYSHVQHTIVSSYTDLPADSSRESYVESDDTTGLVLSESSTSIERIALISTLR
jgi:hypothetical protein